MDFGIKPTEGSPAQPQAIESHTTLSLQEGSSVEIQPTLKTQAQQRESHKIKEAVKGFFATILYGITFGFVDLRSKTTILLQEPREGAEQQEASPLQAHNALREFNLPKRLCKDADITDSSSLPSNFRQLVQAMRNCGQRRDKRNEGLLLQHEARFLGITEAEYKNLLIRSGDKSREAQWRPEINNERNIKGLLAILSKPGPIDGTKCAELTRLLHSHPALAKPEYFAQMHLIAQKAPQKDQKVILEAMRKVGGNLNSRRIQPFLEEVQAYLRHQGVEVGREVLSPFFTEVQKPAEEGIRELPRDQILQWVTSDLHVLDTIESQLETYQSDPAGLKAFLDTNMKSQHVANMLIPADNDPPMSLQDRIALARTKLTHVQERQQEWQEHPEKAVSYFHATPEYKQTLQGKVAVTGEGTIVQGKMSFVGAFVAKKPLIQYGSVAIGFTRDVEFGAKAVNTRSMPNQTANDIWLGFNRALATSPTAYNIGRQIQQSIHETILSQPEIQSLPREQFEALAIGLGHLLENNVDVNQVGADNWEIVLHTSDGKQTQDVQAMIPEILQSLSTSFEAFPQVQKGCTALLQNPTIAQTLADSFKETLQQAGSPPKTPEKGTHMAAVIAFDEEPLLQARLQQEFEGKKPTPTLEEVRAHCNERIPGIPIIPWTEAEICSDYDIMLGLKEIRLRDQGGAMKKISKQRSFF